MPASKVLGQSGLTLGRSHPDATYSSPVHIFFPAFDTHLFAKDHLGQTLFRFVAKSQPLLWQRAISTNRPIASNCESLL
jgi:hypothetical protein